MTGKLYVIGVGPGDPELLTLKAVRILKEVSCICVPKGREEGSSLALSIIQKAINLERKEVIEAHFPMRKTRTRNLCPPTHPSPSRGEGKGGSELNAKWNETVKNILSRLNKGLNVAFITLGDPAIYSTFFYLYDRLLELNPELNIEIIPGVSSINTVAAKACISLALADEKIAILPANYIESLKDTIQNFDTVVLMKVHKAFKDIIKLLDKMELTNNAIYISRAGMEGEKIFNNISTVKDENLDYFSIMIIKK
jgi:precorrin-2/cobalt-factor-2 C20-methyltransferase